MTQQYLPPALEREIWRYLEDEERYFLERWWLPGKKITEDVKEKALEDLTDEDLNKPSMTIQRAANFAAGTGWTSALEVLAPCINLRKALLSAAYGGQVRSLLLLKKYAGSYFLGNDYRLLDALAHGGCESGLWIVLGWVWPALSKRTRREVVFSSLESAARGGQFSLLRQLINLVPLPSAVYLARLILAASGRGRIEIVRWIWGLGKIQPGLRDVEDKEHPYLVDLMERALLEAADGNHVDTMKELWTLAKEHITLSKSLCFCGADDNKTDSLKLVKQWCDEKKINFISADSVQRAIVHDNVEALKLMQQWSPSTFRGLTDADKMNLLEIAVDIGSNTAAMKEIKKWGVPAHSSYFASAAINNYTEPLKLLREWGPDWGGYDRGVLNRAALDLVKNAGPDEGCVDALKLLRSWGATDFAGALAVCRHPKIRQLLQKWIGAPTPENPGSPSC